LTEGEDELKRCEISLEEEKGRVMMLEEQFGRSG